MIRRVNEKCCVTNSAFAIYAKIFKSMFFYIPSSEQKSEGKNTILKTIATNCIYQDGM